MQAKKNSGAAILVVNDVEEVRDGLQSLLEADGYRVAAARSERYATESTIREPPQLILINLAGSPEEVIAAARRISHGANLESCVPVVLFCVEGMEATEINLGGNLYSLWPDNFNAVRAFLQKLLGSLHAD